MYESSNNVIEKLNRNGNKLSKSHRKIASFISENYDKAVFMTASRLGEVVNISESTVVRFATALGYDGYPQMQKALQEIVRHRLTSTQRFELSAELSQDELLDTALKTDIRNIRTTLDQLDRKVFSGIVDEISRAQTIYVLGLRSAAPLAEFLGYYLHYIFDDVRIVNAMSNNVFETISRIRPTDALFAISFPRYSSRTLESMNFARSRGAKVLALTDGPLSPLHEQADLCMDAQTDMTSFVDSVAAPMSLVNALLMALGMKNRETLSRNFRELEEIWDKYRVYAGK